MIAISYQIVQAFHIVWILFLLSHLWLLLHVIALVNSLLLLQRLEFLCICLQVLLYLRSIFHHGFVVEIPIFDVALGLILLD